MNTVLLLPFTLEAAWSLPVIAAAAPSGTPVNAPVGIGYLTNSFTDMTTWVVFLTLVAFLAIVWRLGVFTKILGLLDNRAESIRVELEQARSLRKEAMQALSDARIKATEADRIADEIMRSAQSEADTMIKQAEVDLAARITLREEKVAQHIARAENEAVQAVRQAAADMTIHAAQTILSTDAHADSLFDKALADVDRIQ